MSVTIKSGSHTVTWEDGELTGSSKLVKTLQAAARFNFHRGVDLLPTGPTWDITLGDARGTAALATYLQLPWDSDEIDLGEGCVPDLDLDVEPTPFWPKNKKIAKSQGLAIAKHGDGSHDDKDHGNRHTHVVTPTGKVGTIHDSTRAADWMAEDLDTEELANAVYAMKVEVGDSTWETRITSTGIQNATLGPFQQVKGDIIKDGSKVGHFWHSLRPDKNSAHLGAIYIESEHQGTGAGSMIVAHWEDELAGLGIKEVTLETVEIGRYAWALAGFDFKSPADREAVRSAAASAARLLRYSGTSIPSELNDELRVVLESDFSPLDLALVGFNHPWRGKAVNHQVFSEFTEIKGTHHLGKALMLSGPGWDGKKTLTQLAKSLTAAGLVWREWALDNPAAVESDDPEFLKELADALAGKITKSLSPNFGKRNRRQANLMSKLRGARNYAKPVRGGTGAQQRTRRSKFAKGLGLDSFIAKHGDGSHDDKDHNPHKHVSSPSGKPGVLWDSSAPWEGMDEYLEPTEIAETIFGGTLELPDGSKFTSQIVNAEKDGKGGYDVRGVIVNEAGEHIAKFHRILNADGTAYSKEFHMEKGQQGSGIGTMFVAHWESELAAAGFDQIILEAGGSLGAYTWAIAGYDFKSDADRQRVKQGFQQWSRDMNYHGWTIPQDLWDETQALFANPNSRPIDFALLGHDHEFRVPSFTDNYLDKSKMHYGKALLLGGTGWWGKKNIGSGPPRVEKEPESDPVAERMRHLREQANSFHDR